MGFGLRDSGVACCHDHLVRGVRNSVTGRAKPEIEPLHPEHRSAGSLRPEPRLPATGARPDPLDRRRRVLGNEDPETLRTAHNLAGALAMLGLIEAARKLGEETLTRRQRVLGANHPDTVATRKLVATGAVRSVETIATGLKWKRLREPLTVIGTPDAKDRGACWELGATVAAGLMLSGPTRSSTRRSTRPRAKATAPPAPPPADPATTVTATTPAHPPAARDGSGQAEQAAAPMAPRLRAGGRTPRRRPWRPGRSDRRQSGRERQLPAPQDRGGYNVLVDEVMRGSPRPEYKAGSRPSGWRL
jgi:hypothetical protein